MIYCQKCDRPLLIKQDRNFPRLFPRPLPVLWGCWFCAGEDKGGKMKLKSQDGQCECKVDDVAYLSVNDDGKTCVRVSADAKMISICKNMIIIFNAEEKFCNTLMEVVKEYLQ